MRNFRKIVLMAVILVCMESVTGFLLEPVTFQHSLDRELQYMEEQNWMPNMVFLGDSRVACGIKPRAVEKKLGDGFCVLNAATGSQQIWGSYYYLKDLLEQYEVKTVILGVDQWAFVQREKSVKKELIVLERIENPLIRLDYIKNIFQPEEYPYLIKSYAYRAEVPQIPEHLAEKMNWDFFFGKFRAVDKKNLNRGHVAAGAGMGEDRVGINELVPFENGKVNPKALEYLDRIVKLCKERQISLYLVCMPVTSTSVYATETYENFYAFFQKYAMENEVTFWDLNLLKDRMEVIPDGMMSDMEHIGEPLDEQISWKIGELLKRDMEDSEVKTAFFPTVDSWKESLDGIIGCDFFTQSQEKANGRKMTAISLQENGVVPEYEFWACQDGQDAEWVLLQKYSEKNYCIVSEKYFEEDVWLKVCCREKGSNVPYEKCCKRMRCADEGN